MINDEYEKLTKEEKKGFSASSIVPGNYDILANNPEASKIFYDKKMANLDLKLVNANQDLTAKEITPDGVSVLLNRQGYFAKQYETAGKQVVKIGKPYPDIMKITINKIRSDTKKINPNILIVGDNINTDVMGVTKIREDHKYLGEAQVFSTLCLNSYWTENNKNVNAILKIMKQCKITEKLGKIVLEKYIKRMGEKTGAVPNNIISWTSISNSR